MNIKRFIARNTQEALRMVKEEMGTEAVILRTRTIRGGEKTAPNGNETIEVTAAVDYDVPSHGRQHEKDTGARALIERYENLEAQIREIRDLLWSIEAGVILQPDTIFDPQARGQYGYLKDLGTDEITVVEAQDGLRRHLTNLLNPHRMVDIRWRKDRDVVNGRGFGDRIKPNILRGIITMREDGLDLESMFDEGLETPATDIVIRENDNFHQDLRTRDIILYPGKEPPPGKPLSSPERASHDPPHEINADQAVFDPLSFCPGPVRQVFRWLDFEKHSYSSTLSNENS